MNVRHFAGSTCRFARREGALTTTDARRVTCRTCSRSTMVLAAAIEQKREREAAYDAAEPHELRSPWNNKPIVCRECGSDLFRSRGRTLDYYVWRCAGCGTDTETMTETGMSA